MQNARDVVQEEIGLFELGCREIRRYNGKYTCIIGMISQDHAKFNYTVSYRKAWLAKQKSVAKVFDD
ncbi:hypothetical protein Ahy_B07g087032 [Arachis hypogaea]|uniref:Uncharacterized protein n=1 Tax=Arachis hypogaea TaxID=3818 RepID=A0A444YB38_ARAHY|nr:hypothetical protein Ahy_B07g087032 [Arachis hypogaea]